MTENAVFQRIQQELNENDVVLYMKGTPMFPQCGFSAAVVQALSILGVKFKGDRRTGRLRLARGHQAVCQLADDPAAVC